MSVDKICQFCDSYEINHDRCEQCRRWYIYLDDLFRKRDND